MFEDKPKKKTSKLTGCLAIFFALAILSAFFGDQPSQPYLRVQSSPWDGSVRQVKDWVKANLKDPDSLEFIEWSPLSRTTDGGYVVRAKYRAKNSFGGYVVENQLFTLNSSGTVISCADF